MKIIILKISIIKASKPPQNTLWQPYEKWDVHEAISEMPELIVKLPNLSEVAMELP